MKDHRKSLKYVWRPTDHRSRASHAPLKQAETPCCPHRCNEELQLLTENSSHQIWGCNGCHSMVKVEKKGTVKAGRVG